MEKGEDLATYVSAIANMNGGHIVIGVKDGMLNIVGIENLHDYTPETLPYRLLGACPNLSSEGLSVEAHTTTDTGRTVWIVHIPKHLPRKPVYAHNKELRPEREASILAELLVPFADSKLFPDEIDKYNPWTIYEALYNAKHLSYVGYLRLLQDGKICDGLTVSKRKQYNLKRVIIFVIYYKGYIMTMTITVNDSIADKVMAFLNSFPKEAVKIEPSRPWYADEVKRRADEYRRGEMKTVSLDQAFWDEMDDYIDTVA